MLMICKIIGTINYEILCMIGRRVPRVYIKNGKYNKCKKLFVKIQNILLFTD